MKTGWIVFLIIVTCMFQPGCDIRNYVYTDSSLKWIAQRSLKKKYGEEFVIYRVWDKSQEMFFATCSPKDDPEVVFDADINKNGDGVESDGYAQEVVAKKVKELLKDDIQELFGKCYFRSEAYTYYNAPEFKNASEITIEEYISNVEYDHIMCWIYLSSPKKSKSDIDKEYSYFSQVLQEKIRNKTIPKLTVIIYFSNDEMIEQCEEYYTTHADINYEFGRKLDNYEKIVFEYENGVMNMTYEEYKNLRETYAE